MSRPTTASSASTSTTSTRENEAIRARASQVQNQGHGTKERVVFSGPNGLRPHYKGNLTTDFHYMAQCEMYTPERTTKIAYLNRDAPDAPFPLAKNGRPGEIGWEAVHFHNMLSKR